MVIFVSKKQALFIEENGKMENQMVGEKIIILIVVTIKDLLLMEFLMVQEDSLWKMVIFMKDKLNLEEPMETVIS